MQDWGGQHEICRISKNRNGKDREQRGNMESIGAVASSGRLQWATVAPQQPSQPIQRSRLTGAKRPSLWQQSHILEQDIVM